jgi:hypothetical protein
MRERYLRAVIDDMPKTIKILEDNLEDLYWKFILRHAALESREKLSAFELIYSQILADRTVTTGRTKTRRHPYCEYKFTSNGITTSEGLGFGVYRSYYGPSVSHGRITVVITGEEEKEIDDIKNQYSMEEARVSDFSLMVRKKMYSVTTTSKLSEILPDFAKHIPT